MAGGLARKAFFVYNDSSTVFYVKFVATGSSGLTQSNFSVRLPSGTYYEQHGPAFTGQVYGLFHSGSATGQVNMHELS